MRLFEFEYNPEVTSFIISNIQVFQIVNRLFLSVGYWRGLISSSISMI